jgi:homoprotocatechuate degradation regulator HpaR
MLSETDQTEKTLVAAQTPRVIGTHPNARFLVETLTMARKKSSKDLPSKPAGKPGVRRVPMREFSRSLPMSLLRAREAVMRHFRPSLRDHGLTEQQWRILRALAAIDDIEVTELAGVAFLLGPSLSRILRDLEARHLIERKVAKADLRRGVVSISENGLRLMEAVAPSSEAIYAAITKRYGTRKLAELQKMLHALEGSLSELRVADEGNAERDEFE